MSAHANESDESEQPDEQSTGTSFAQEYDPTAKQKTKAFLYCRLCRRIFAVTVKLRPHVTLRCKCSHETSVGEIDVFKSEARAKDFAGLYERLYQAAKEALRAANLPAPPSGRFKPIRDGMDIPSDIMPVNDADAEDVSDIGSSYVGEGSDVRGSEAQRKEDELREALAGAGDDPIAKHEVLSELVEHLYCVRNLEPGAFERFEEVCAEDMVLALDVIDAVKRRRRSGRPARVKFTSFKHLALALEETGELEKALEVVEGAIAVGLPGYDERAERLRAQIAEAAAEAEAERARKAARKKPSRSGRAVASASKRSPAASGKSPKARASAGSDRVRRKGSERQAGGDPERRPRGGSERQGRGGTERLDDDEPLVLLDDSEEASG